jgi:hypothetical protein
MVPTPTPAHTQKRTRPVTSQRDSELLVSLGARP